MSTDADPNATKQPADADATSSERREALIKLGKDAAYATPVVVASISAVTASFNFAPGGVGDPRASVASASIASASIASAVIKRFRAESISLMELTY